MPKPRLVTALGGLLLIALFLAVLVQLLPPAALTLVVDEDGIIEQLSVFAWLGCALYALYYQRSNKLVTGAAALIFLVLAVRETGLPPELIPSGKALLRLSYYSDASLPWLQRAGIAAILLSVLASLLLMAATSCHYLCKQQGYRQLEGKWLLAAGLILVAGQGCEWIAEHGLVDIRPAYLVFWGWEELLECAAPVFVLGALRRSAPGGWLAGCRADPPPGQ